MDIQWSLVLFTALTGSAGWLLACVGVNEARGAVRKCNFNAALVALIVLAVGGLASVTHLSHPENIMGALSHPTSGIFVEVCLVAATGLCNLVYLIVKKREVGAGVVKLFALAAGVFGVILSFMAGASYMMASQEAWNTVLMPLGYALTDLPVGAALYLLFAAKEGDVSLEARILGVGGVLAALGALVFGLASGYLGAVAALVVGGSVIVGGLVPAACGFAAGKGKQVLALAAVAVVCALVGAICYRCGMWEIGYGVNNFFHIALG